MYPPRLAPRAAETGGHYRTTVGIARKEGYHFSYTWVPTSFPDSPHATMDKSEQLHRQFDCWMHACDTNQNVESRFAALWKCIREDTKRAAILIADELQDVGRHSPDWQAALIFASEAVTFDLPNASSVRNRLFEVVESIRSDPNSAERYERVLWAAIRQCVSLTTPDHADEIATFLHEYDGYYGRTKLVTLQAVAHHFEPTPCGQLKPSTLLDVIAQHADKHLDPLFFQAGEISAIACEAVHALAALGDERLVDSVVRAKQLRKSWLNEILLELLEHTHHKLRAANQTATFQAANVVRTKAIELLRKDMPGNETPQSA